MKDVEHTLDMVAHVNNSEIQIQDCSNNRSNEEALVFKHAIRVLFDLKHRTSYLRDIQSQVKSDDHQTNRNRSHSF